MVKPRPILSGADLVGADLSGAVLSRAVAPSKPGASSTWAKGSPTDGIGNGRKTLWVWHR